MEFISTLVIEDGPQIQRSIVFSSGNAKVTAPISIHFQRILLSRMRSFSEDKSDLHVLNVPIDDHARLIISKKMVTCKFHLGQIDVTVTPDQLSDLFAFLLES